jgi:hypothetical protein
MRVKQRESVMSLFWLVMILFVAHPYVNAGKRAPAANRDVSGTWTGSYETDGGSGELSYFIKKGEKNQWSGSLKFTNQDGVNTAEFKSLQISDGKLNARIVRAEPPVEITIEGVIRGDQMEGTYSVSASGTTDVVEKGTWKVSRKTPAKAGQ